MHSLPGLRRREAPAGRSRRHIERQPEVIYAIGDLHGCADLMVRMEEEIARDAAAIAGEKWIVWLGDAIDRGPQSAKVIDRFVRKREDSFTRICLAGNHELSMADFLIDPSPTHPWLSYGGWQTLLSYGIPWDRLEGAGGNSLRDLVSSHIPPEHLEWVAALPVMLTTPYHALVHAGLRPGIPLERQTDKDLTWFNDGLADDYADVGKVVVHGHVVVEQPLNGPARICVDTGANETGILTGVRLTGPRDRTFLAVSQSSKPS
jgi:serine/threonine protein phosphatase 1